MKYIAISSLLLAATVAHAQLDAIRTLTPTNNQTTLRPIEAQIFAVPQTEHSALEKELLEIFQSPTTTLAGKQYACRMLRHCASEACIPVLAPQLIDPKLSQFVRRVFQGLDSPAVDPILIKALHQVTPPLQIGILGTLGQRRSVKSINAIKPYLKNPNPQIQSAAITALGNIGGRSATKALLKTKVAPELSTELKLTILKCASTLDSKSAEKIYMKYRLDDHVQVQIVSVVGLTKIAPTKFTPEVVQLLESSNPKYRNTAIVLLASLPTPGLIEEIEALAPENQVLVISTLADRKATEAEAVMLKLANSENKSVRNAALLALGNIGTTASIQPLLAVTATNIHAFTALCSLNAEGADAAIILSLKNASDEPTTIKRLECLALRQTHAALPAAVKVAESPWSRQTKTAIDTIETLVRTEDFPLFAQLMLSATETKKLQVLEKSAAKAALRQIEINPCAQPLIDAIAGAKPESQYALLRTLGRMGGEVAREQLTQSIGSSDPGTKDAAIRGLCNWPNLDVADQLLEQAQTATIPKQRTLALRGYIRLAGTTSDFAVVSNMCYTAAATANQPAELIATISCMQRFQKQEVLDFLAPHLDNVDVFDEAAWAICEISNRKNLQQSALPLLQKIAAVATDEKLMAEVNKKIEQYQKTETPALP